MAKHPISFRLPDMCTTLQLQVERHTFHSLDILCARRFRRRWFYRESFLQRISTFLDLPEDTESSAFLCCFSTFHPLVFSYISSIRLSLHNEFSCLFIPRLLSFPLSHGVSSSLLYQSFIIFHAPQIMVPSLYLLNDDKMHLYAQQLRWNHCRKLLYSLILFDLSLKDKLQHIYHCTFQSTAQGCSMQRQHSFETGAIRSDKTVSYPRGFP